MANIFHHVRDWYARFERPISSLSLVGGFVFDAVTLTRVDKFWDNIWVVGHVLIVAISIVWINAAENSGQDEHDPAKLHFWLVNVCQFFFGGILSTFLVFYFRSSDISVSWPFILLLVLAFWANESLKHHYARLSFQISLFYLSLFSFAIYLTPIITHEISTRMFLLSGLVSLVAIGLFMLVLFFASREKFHHSKWLVASAIAGIFIIINILYFTNFIPPLPLSLKDGGVYHGLVKNSDGDYVAQYENLGWRQYVTLYPDFHLVSGDPVYVYSAVFSPSKLNTEVVHEWQYLNPQTGKWENRGRISLSVIGGRDGGFRTFSLKTDLDPGHWRVNVETPTGQVIGRIRFNVVEVAVESELTTETH